jgi:membrane protein implicated in regulation of membrane protease activity
MYITYNLTERDFEIYYNNVVSRRLFIFKPIVYLIALIIAFLATYYIDLNPLNSFRFWIQFLLFFIFFLCVILIVRQKSLIALNKQLLSKSLTSDQVKFSYEGDIIRSETELIKYEYNVKLINKIEDWKEYYYLYILDKKVIIIPKKYILDNSMFNDFLKIINHKLVVMR